MISSSTIYSKLKIENSTEVEVVVFSPFPDFITSARRELIPSEDFLVFFVGAISALFRMSNVEDSGGCKGSGGRWCVG